MCAGNSKSAPFEEDIQKQRVSFSPLIDAPLVSGSLNQEDLDSFSKEHP